MRCITAKFIFLRFKIKKKSLTNTELFVRRERDLNAYKVLLKAFASSKRVVKDEVIP